MFSSARLQDKVVLVTGASGGIGAVCALASRWSLVLNILHCARLLQSCSRRHVHPYQGSPESRSSMPQAGANVILTARRKEALEIALEQVKAAYRESRAQAGGKFAAITLDVSKRDEVAALWAKVPDELRNVDILGTIVLPSSSLTLLTTFASGLIYSQ